MKKKKLNKIEKKKQLFFIMKTTNAAARDNLLIDYYDILKNEITAKQIVSCISSPN